MIVKEAVMKLDGFWILESSLKFNRELFLKFTKRRKRKENKKNNIDLVYFIFKSGSTRYRIDCNIKSVGYVGNFLNFEIKTESHFLIPKLKSKEDIDNKILGNAIPVIISNIRGYLYSVSLMFPMNNYLLPLIDLSEYYIRIRKKKSNKRSPNL